MPIPDYETLMLPMLRLFAQGIPNVASCVPYLKEEFAITDDESAELLPSGTQTILQNRAHWARTYLAKAGLLASPGRNRHVITDVGRQILAQAPHKIDNAFLSDFQAFNQWIDSSKANAGVNDVSANDDGGEAGQLIEDTQTPEDVIETASNILHAALRDDLLALLYQMSPQRFERLILDLLSAMGYGGGNIERTTLTKASGDGGIDGIIYEDALGLDAVYIQAKRYSCENKVGRPDLQRFIGSLTGEGATKGVFVTTSDFSKEAQDYLRKVQHRVMLINGARLAQFMIAHGVGVRTRKTYAIRSVDEDYFSDVIV